MPIMIQNELSLPRENSLTTDKFKGKVAIVTEASHGIGASIAKKSSRLNNHNQYASEIMRPDMQ